MTTAKREAALFFLSTISLGSDTPQEAIHSPAHSPKPSESTYDDYDSTPPTPLARPPRPRRKSTMRHDATSFLANISLSLASSTTAAAAPQPSAQSIEIERRQSDNQTGHTPFKRVTTRGQKAPLTMPSTLSGDDDENGESDVSRQRTTLANDRAFREVNVVLQEFNRTCEDGVDGRSRANTLRKPKRSQSMWNLKPKKWQYNAGWLFMLLVHSSLFVSPPPPLFFLIQLPIQPHRLSPSTVKTLTLPPIHLFPSPFSPALPINHQLAITWLAVHIERRIKWP